MWIETQEVKETVMKHSLYVKQYGDEIQKYQVVHLDTFRGFSEISPGNGAGLPGVADIYRRFLVPACPWLFPDMILFQSPAPAVKKTQDLPFVGSVQDTLVHARQILSGNLVCRNGKVHGVTEAAQALWQHLQETGMAYVIRGKRPGLTVIPVGTEMGYLSAHASEGSLLCNASFFIMNPFDCASPYDHIGQPFGLMIQDGIVRRPPLYDRPVLLVDNQGKVQVTRTRLRRISIGTYTFTEGADCIFHMRPNVFRTPAVSGQDLVLIGDRVAAVHAGGKTIVPASGLVVQTQKAVPMEPGMHVVYRDWENVQFGIQGGCSAVQSGIPTDSMDAAFFHPGIVMGPRRAYPPTLYSRKFTQARAARMVIGCDRHAQPMLIWAEGAPKVGYVPGQHSRGATLQETNETCAFLGMRDGIHIDGGGSAQILLSSQRHLQLADRHADGTEMERAIPSGLRYCAH